MPDYDIDLTLDSLMIPAISATFPFGTKVIPTAENKGGLSTFDVNSNMMLGYNARFRVHAHARDGGLRGVHGHFHEPPRSRVHGQAERRDDDALFRSSGKNDVRDVGRLVVALDDGGKRHGWGPDPGVVGSRAGCRRGFEGKDRRSLQN